MGYDIREVSEMLGVSTRTASKYGEGLFVHSDRKTSGIKTYAIPKVIWAEWDRVTQSIIIPKTIWAEWDIVTKSLRKYFCKSKV